MNHPSNIKYQVNHWRGCHCCWIFEPVVDPLGGLDQLVDRIKKCGIRVTGTGHPGGFYDHWGCHRGQGWVPVSKGKTICIPETICATGFCESTTLQDWFDHVWPSNCHWLGRSVFISFYSRTS
jgi:hypothetical protein